MTENLTRALRPPLRVGGDCATADTSEVGFSCAWASTIGPFIFGLFREHQTWEAPVRVLLYLTGWRTCTAVTISGALAHDWIAQAAAR